AVQRALADESKWDDFEQRFQTEVFGKLPMFFASMPSSAAKIARELRVPELKRRATKEGAEGQAAKRLLEAVYAQTNFYLMRQLMAKGEYAVAAATLTVATDIHPDRWPAFYNLGAAYARAGDKRHALDSLAKAIDIGFKDAALLASDEDYASVRNDERFKKLLLALSSQ
ncbi:MAG: TPR end-of-group domain-containing protein, partial [Thermoanaerobaculia bacterium]